MSDAMIKALLESGVINEEAQAAITEAWNSKLNEAKEQIRAELREEFSQRHAHDKKVMAEALDKLVTTELTAELKEFAEEKKALAEDRVKARAFMVESAGKFNQFMIDQLTKEIKELREDRARQAANMKKVEAFVIHALSEEIQEFSKDKKDLVETKVKLVAEGRKKLAALQEAFIKRSARLVKESVTAKLEMEISQLKEDVQAARENMFGRKIFEAYAAEFGTTYLNENKEIAKLRESIAAKDKIIAETKKTFQKTATLVESKEREIRIIKESAQRNELLGELLGPLNKEKATVMSSLLESVQTDRLRSVYEKYLPAVLNNSSVKPTAQKKVLSEGHVAMTGDKKTARVADDTNVIELKRLAGLN
jgi:hypothetical protein